MNVLFIGPNCGTSLHRCNGFRRLGHHVRLIDPRLLLPGAPTLDRFVWNVHPEPFASLAGSRLRQLIKGEHYDLAFVDGGSLVNHSLVRELQRQGMRVVNFNHDDPFGTRDRAYFRAYRRAVSQYDLLVVVRKENIAEAKAQGARKVIFTFRSADEIEHTPRPIPPELATRWRSDVVFIGTWMPERGQFLAELLALGVPLSIFGNRWDKAPEWTFLQRAFRGQGLVGADYSYAVQCARICIGLLSRENRDLHTTRSLEIPSLGSLFCAQRTSEHENMYLDGEEAVFWDNAKECADHCLDLLQNEARRSFIAANGRARFLANGHRTERLLQRILNETFA